MTSWEMKQTVGNGKYRKFMADVVFLLPVQLAKQAAVSRHGNEAKGKHQADDIGG